MSQLPVGRTRIKICGVRRLEDVVTACRLGVDALGLNFCPASKRFITAEAAADLVAVLPALVTTVGVFVDADATTIRRIVAQVGLSTVQLHGDEPAELVADLAPTPVIKAFRWTDVGTVGRIEQYLADCWRCQRLPGAVLIDGVQVGQAGGTGQTWDWSAAVGKLPTALPVILAGGLRPDNVTNAIRQLRPFAVDTAGGVESTPGVKDPEQMRQFVSAVRQAEEMSA